MRALQKEPGDRYQDVAALGRDVERFSEGKSVDAYRESAFRRFRKLCLRHPVISVSALVAIAVLLATVSSLFLARTLRLKSFLELAEEHKAAGDQAYTQKVELYRQLSALRADRGEGAPSDRERAMAAEMETLQSQTEVDYSLAVSLYSTVGRLQPRPGPRVRAGLGDITEKRLAYAYETNDFAEAEKWLDFMRKAIEGRFKNVPEDLRQRLREYEATLEAARRGVEPAP